MTHSLRDATEVIVLLLPLKLFVQSSIKGFSLMFHQKCRSGSISTQLMMFLIFVVFLASWTAFAPVSRIKLERSDQTITATVRRCMYFIVPYYTQQLTDVSNVRVETYKGEKQGYNAGSGINKSINLTIGSELVPPARMRTIDSQINQGSCNIAAIAGSFGNQIDRSISAFQLLFVA